MEYVVWHVLCSVKESGFCQENKIKYLININRSLKDEIQKSRKVEI